MTAKRESRASPEEGRAYQNGYRAGVYDAAEIAAEPSVYVTDDAEKVERRRTVKRIKALAAAPRSPPAPTEGTREDARDYGEGYRDGLLCALRKATARGQKDLADDLALAAMAPGSPPPPAPLPEAIRLLSAVNLTAYDVAPGGEKAACESIHRRIARFFADRRGEVAPPPEDSGARACTTCEFAARKTFVEPCRSCFSVGGHPQWKRAPASSKEEGGRHE